MILWSLSLRIAGGFALRRFSGDCSAFLEGGGWESEMGGGLRHGSFHWGFGFGAGGGKACIHVAMAGDDSGYEYRRMG